MEYINRDKMSETAKVFAEIAAMAFSKGGFGSTKTWSYSDTGYAKHAKELNWLVQNGYLFCYENVERRVYHGRWFYHTIKVRIYGVTKKGWAVTHHYIDFNATDENDKEIAF